MTAPAPARADATNLDLMRKMGSTKGYDPIPPDQHAWQKAKGEPLIHRIWSVLCAHTIRARAVDAKTVRTPYATRDDGTTPFTPSDLAKELDEDRGNVRRAWLVGEQKGLWRRDEKARLWLSGSITPEQVTEANERRKGDCTHDLTPMDVNKIKHLPKERRDQFWKVWEARNSYRPQREARALMLEREALDQIDDNIKTAFGLEVRRLEKKPRKPIETPECLCEFVQTGSNEPDRTDHQNAFVQTSASLLDSEETTEVGQSEVLEQREANGPADLPPQPPPRTEPETQPETQPETKVEPAPPDEAELARVRDAIHAGLGRICPGQLASNNLCLAVLAALGETPLNYYGAALWNRAERAIRRHEPTSLKLAEFLAAEVATRWRSLPEAQKSLWIPRADPQPKPWTLTKADVESLRADLANPACHESQKQYARELLEEHKDLVEQIEKAAAGKRLT